MVILSVGQNPSPDFADICRGLNLRTNKWGYCQTEGNNPVATNRRGVYACGSASGPKDIADTLIESTAAAGQVLLSYGKHDLSNLNVPSVSVATPASEPETVVFVCNCNQQLSSFIDTAKITAYAGTLSGVIKSIEVTALCQPESRQQVVDCLKDNHVVIAGCSRVMSGEFTPNMRNPIDIIDIRENLAWVHQNEKEAAAEKVCRLISMSLEKLKRGDSHAIPATSFSKRALVIGGGLAGMTAASQMAKAGIIVDIIEFSDRLGGNSVKVHHLLVNKDFPVFLQQLEDDIAHNPLIHLKLNTELLHMSGYAGNYKCILQEKNGVSSEIETGAVIVASGAEEHHPVDYLFDKSERVITQSQLEERLEKKYLLPVNIKSIAMIQCVGCRDNDRPYCSRICCIKALRNALFLKQENPQIAITLFYRDMMSYGLKEEYYTRAREKGILFLRYDPPNKPVVSLENGALKLTAFDPELGEEITFNPDLVILSSAIVPVNKKLAEILDVALTPDGFMNEVDVKFRPVDLEDGVYVCGLAHSPRDHQETILQAQAVAQRVVALLVHRDVKSGSNISRVNERKCAGCERCIQVCPYHARIKDGEKKVARVISSLCHGCGICVAACPNQAAIMDNARHEQIFSMIDTIV